jgi:hypothetical protein
MILYAIHNYKLCIVFIGIYSLAVPWWDLVVWKPSSNRKNKQYIAGARLGAGIIYCFLGLLLYFADDSKLVTENKYSLLVVLNVLLLSIVALKIIGTHSEIKKQDQEG